ncbi:hypothetical protein BX666DRAFT_1914130 [Dichotomocladium elegans]|nr:hypothetical protein BX666DRAFT_1914130 [Dichotomocladium elegans]
MFPHKQQPAFKFVIHSKLSESEKPVNTTEITKDNGSPTEPEESLSGAATAAVPTANGAIVGDNPSASADSERKRKRNEKDQAILVPKKIHSQLQRWNQKKAELKDQARMEGASLENDVDGDSGDKDVEHYADYTIMACLLCQRKFKSLPDLQKHQEASELHKKNLLDPVCIGKAQLKMRYKKTEGEQAEEQAAEQNYRNRAAERRHAYGQPDKPVLSTSQHHHPREPKRQPININQLRTKHQQLKESTAAAASLNKPLDDSNVGARMLQQMGWRRGEGLGKDAMGIVNPIAAEQYAQGVGLGAAHAKTVLPSSSTAETYKEKAIEMARRRFEEELEK